MNKPVLIYFVCFLIISFESCRSDGKPTDGIKIVYFDDGKTIHQSICYKNGRKNGEMKLYYETGVLKARQFYMNDTLNDTSAMYYPDGKLRSLQVYKNKQKYGRWLEYNKLGKLYSEIFFKNGLLDSTSSIFTYRTGKLLTRVTYKEGVKNGAEEHYYANGKPKSKAYFDGGMPCPGLEEWYENGKKIDNDFKVTIGERNELLLKGKYTYILTPAGMRKNDEAYLTLPPTQGKRLEAFKSLKKSAGGFELEYEVAKGDYLMNKEYIAILRKTSMGNTYIKVQSINVAINNY